MHVMKVFVFSHSASVERFGQLTNKFFLMHIVMMPVSMLSHFGGGPGGGGPAPGGGGPGGPVMFPNFCFQLATKIDYKIFL